MLGSRLHIGNEIRLALPLISDINLFCYCQRIIYFDAEISDRVFDLGMSEQKLDGPEIAGAPIDQGSFCASQRMGPKKPRDPTLPIHSDTRRAYWRVDMAAFAPPRAVNKNSPGLLLAALS